MDIRKKKAKKRRSRSPAIGTGLVEFDMILIGELLAAPAC